MNPPHPFPLAAMRILITAAAGQDPGSGKPAKEAITWSWEAKEENLNVKDLVLVFLHIQDLLGEAWKMWQYRGIVLKPLLTNGNFHFLQNNAT